MPADNQPRTTRLRGQITAALAPLQGEAFASLSVASKVHEKQLLQDVKERLLSPEEKAAAIAKAAAAAAEKAVRLNVAATAEKSAPKDAQEPYSTLTSTSTVKTTKAPAKGRITLRSGTAARMAQAASPAKNVPVLRRRKAVQPMRSSAH